MYFHLRHPFPKLPVTEFNCQIITRSTFYSLNCNWRYLLSVLWMCCIFWERLKALTVLPNQNPYPLFCKPTGVCRVYEHGSTTCSYKPPKMGWHRIMVSLQLYLGCGAACQLCCHAAVRATKRELFPCSSLHNCKSQLGDGTYKTSESGRKQSLSTLLSRGHNLCETFLIWWGSSWKHYLLNTKAVWSGLQNILIKEKMLIHFHYLSGLLFPGSGLWHSWHQCSQPYTTHQHNGCIILTGPGLNYSNACWHGLVTGSLCQQFYLCINPFV